MRKLKTDEAIKRGCLFCTHCDIHKLKYQGVKLCKLDTCPYHELDDYDTYDDYFNAQGEVDFNFLPQ